MGDTLISETFVLDMGSTSIPAIDAIVIGVAVKPDTRKGWKPTRQNSDNKTR
jgi:hypothetical protein